MNYILRTFFYSFGLILLLAAWALNPETAQFKDLLAVLHMPSFWSTVAVAAIVFAGTDMAFSGSFSFVVNAVFNVIKPKKKVA